MASRLDPSVIGAHSHALPRGPRVRLRLAQVRDVRAIEALVRDQGLDPAELELTSLVRSDPRQRIVICASALIGSVETIVGFGSIEVGAVEPETLIVDHELTDGLAELITQALVSRSASIADRRAA